MDLIVSVGPQSIRVAKSPRHGPSTLEPSSSLHPPKSPRSSPTGAKEATTMKTPTKKAITPTARTPTARTPTARTPTARTPTKEATTMKTPTKKARTPTSRTPTARTPTARTPTARTPTKKTSPSNTSAFLPSHEQVTTTISPRGNIITKSPRNITVRSPKGQAAPYNFQLPAVVASVASSTSPTNAKSSPTSKATSTKQSPPSSPSPASRMAVIRSRSPARSPTSKSVKQPDDITTRNQQPQKQQKQQKPQQKKREQEKSSQTAADEQKNQPADSVDRKARKDDKKAAKEARKQKASTRPPNPFGDKSTKTQTQTQTPAAAAHGASAASTLPRATSQQQPPPQQQQQQQPQQPQKTPLQTPLTTPSLRPQQTPSSAQPQLQTSSSSKAKHARKASSVHVGAKQAKQSIVQRTPAKKMVDFFAHLLQYERESSISLKVGSTNELHPAIIRLGLKYAEGTISGSTSRCVAMLTAFKQWIKDYHCPPQKELSRDLERRLNILVQFIIDCRPISLGMGNAIRFLKLEVANLKNVSEDKGKELLIEKIDSYIQERIIFADEVIARNGVSKINDGDVILTYARSHVVEMTLKKAHDMGKRFRVIVVDSRPKLEGKQTLHRLVKHGIECAYTLLNAVSYVMKEVSKVILGAFSMLSNGALVSRVGSSIVAMMAHTYNKPLLVCCETYKFSDRSNIDSFLSVNELGDPDDLIAIPRDEGNILTDWRETEQLSVLNLMYDLTPMNYISLVITECGLIPPTSVPVIIREYAQTNQKRQNNK